MILLLLACASRAPTPAAGEPVQAVSYADIAGDWRWEESPWAHALTVSAEPGEGGQVGLMRALREGQEVCTSAYDHLGVEEGTRFWRERLVSGACPIAGGRISVEVVGERLELREQAEGGVVVVLGR